MTPWNEAAAKTRLAYHAAADTYDHAALGFWDKFGRATVERLPLRAGDRVLDVCCGSGASALPAAERVGPTGRVLGVDLAPGLIALAQAKAARLGRAQAELRVVDYAELDEPAASFDAVVCVFGIFFMPDMVKSVEHLWRWVRPQGTLAITTWGPRVFEPANTIFWDAVRKVRPALYKGFNPWDRIGSPDSVAALLREGGVSAPVAEAQESWHPLASVEDWWTIVIGSGYRGIIEQLGTEEREQVRRDVLAELARREIRAIETNVVFATGVKP